MSFNYKNPLAGIIENQYIGVSRESTEGNTFSVLNVGGYMEVWTLGNLNYSTFGTTGNITNSGNTIPVAFYKRPNPAISDRITLNSDGTSSGRRRIGMLVYVQENDTTYQYRIDNYNTLWDNAVTDGCVTTGSTTYTISNRVGGVEKSGGQALISAWTGSTIEGVNGVTREDARWKIFLGSISVSANTGLGIVSGETLYTTYNTLLSPTLEMPTAVGGIPSGTTVSSLIGDTFVSLFDDLLFPTVLPTYTIPTISIGGVSNTLAEVGSTISLSLTATGVKNDAGRFTELRLLRDGNPIFTDVTLTSGFTTDIPSQFGYTDPNNPNISYTISPTPYSEVYTLPAPTGLNTTTSTLYKADGNYFTGLAKQNNKGATDVRASQVRSVNAPQSASTNYDSTTFTYNNIYPFFWGVSTTQPTTSGIAALISGGSSNKVLLSAAGTIIIPFAAVSQYLWFATFTNYPDKTKWYVDALNNGNIGGPTNLFQSPVSQSVNSPNGYWSGINFDIYIGNYQTTNTSMQLRNS